MGALRAIGCLLVAVAVVACGEPPTRTVSLDTLVFEADGLDGQRVLTSGVVREFDETEALEHHFVLEDAQHNRVQLLPDEVARPHVDERVSVIGLFSFDEETGRRIELESIDPAQ